MTGFRHIKIAIVMVSILYSVGLAGTLRFPPPEFESGHELPSTTTPEPRHGIYEYIDAIVLFAVLGLASYLILKKRSRRAIFALMIFSLLYFGFYRKGCVCPIGSIQNVTLSFFDPNYAVSIVVLIFFLLPLIFTLFFGRTFCAAVCPLGAIQDAVLLRPVSVPLWLENGLRLLAYIYLGAAVLFAAIGSAFIICRYDPFVSFFRLSGNVNILILGACFLVVGLFIGRPYCRFLCPYGVILRHLSRISKWCVTITPDECIQCKLCEDSCPFGAIRKPAVHWPAKEYVRSKKRLALLMVLLPVLIFLGGWAGFSLKTTTARMHPTVRLAERVRQEETGQVEGTTDASDAFRALGTETAILYRDASNIRSRFGTGGLILGGFVGLIIALKLIGVSLWRQRTDYVADRASCLACGRCFEYCPREHLRRKKKSDLQDTTGSVSSQTKQIPGAGQ
jgi:NosR/NirI family nitrous oxide reductase transcriptional regulator